MEIPTLDDLARLARLTALPPGGAWVGIIGCPSWPRGKRLIAAHKEIGIQHMDIYWACKEKLTASPKVNRRGRRNLGLVEAILYDIMKGVEPEDAIAKTVEELTDFVWGSPFRDYSLQTTLITISHPCPEEVRFFNSEVRVLDGDFIRILLQEDMIETKIFGEMFLPTLDDVLRDIADSLQIDGLSKAEAYHMLLTSGESDTEVIPTWFYRPVGWFRETFCEE